MKKFLLIALLLQGCSSLPKRDNKVPQILDFFNHYSIQPVRLGEGMFHGQFEMHVEGTQVFPLSGRVALTAYRQVYFELKTPLNETLLLVVANGKRVWVLEPNLERCAVYRLKEGGFQITNTNLKVAHAYVEALVSGFPFHITQASHGKWKKTVTKSGVIWNWDKTAYKFSSEDDVMPESFRYGDAGVGIQHNFSNWREFFGDDTLFAREVRLIPIGQQGAKRATIKWKKILHLKEKIDPDRFKDPDSIFCDQIKRGSGT